MNTKHFLEKHTEDDMVIRKRVLNIKINSDGIVLDIIDYDGFGNFDEELDLDQLGWVLWQDDPRDIVEWLRKHLVTNSDMYDRVDIDVEGVG